MTPIDISALYASIPISFSYVAYNGCSYGPVAYPGSPPPSPQMYFDNLYASSSYTGGSITTPTPGLSNADMMDFVFTYPQLYISTVQVYAVPYAYPANITQTLFYKDKNGVWNLIDTTVLPYPSSYTFSVTKTINDQCTGIKVHYYISGTGSGGSTVLYVNELILMGYHASSGISINSAVGGIERLACQNLSTGCIRFNHPALGIQELVEVPTTDSNASAVRVKHGASIVSIARTL